MDSSHSSIFDSLFADPETKDENENKTMSPFKNTKLSNSSHQTSNNSIKYFNNLSRNNIFHNTDNIDQLKNNYETSTYQEKSLNTKRVSPESKKVSTNKKIKQLHNSDSDSINLNKEFPYTLKLSPDYEYPGKKYLKFVKKNKEISITPDNKKRRPNESYSSLTIKRPLTVNSSVNNNKCNEQFESSMSSNTFDSFQMNVDMELMKQKTNLGLNLEELLIDCSLSDVLIASKDSNDSLSLVSSSLFDRSYQSYLSADIESVPSQIELTPTQLTLQSNISLKGNSDDLISQEQSNVINICDLINDNNGDQPSQTNQKQNCSLNQEHSEFDQSNLFSEDVSSIEPYPGSELNVCTPFGSVSFEPHYSGRKRCSSSLKNYGKDTIYNIPKKKRKKQRELIHSPFKALKNVSNDSVKKKALDRKKTNRSSSIIENDIGLQYNLDNDLYDMVELPNGATVPSFLSTSKDTKKICACGITIEETPKYWSESLHNILHQNIYKLCFIGKLPENDVVKFKQDNLSYKIIVLNVNHYNDKNIHKCITNINDFICLEYGIPKSNINSLKNSIYLAVLPNLKVIGYLEVEPIQNAHILNHNQQLSEIVPAKFGVQKIWISIKYTDKNVDINLIETFLKKKNLQKEDLAFTLSGRQVVKYIEKGNILIYKK